MLRPPSIEHIQQIDWGYCLPACTQMALAQLGIGVPQARLAKQLGTVALVGTPFPNVQRLEKLGVYVQIVQWQSANKLIEAQRLNRAMIAAILTTQDLPGWQTLQTQHVVVVTQIDATQITYHDPALPYGPVTVQLDAFLLAWREMAEQVALLWK